MPRLGFLIKFIIKFNLCVSESMRFHASSCSINLSPALFCVCWICAMFCIFESHKLQFQCEKGEREEGRKTIKFCSPFFSSFLEPKAHTWREQTEERGRGESEFLLILKAFSAKMQFSFEHHYDFYHFGFYHLIGKFIRFYCRKLDHINYVTWWYTSIQLILHSLEKSSWTSTTNLHTTQQQQHQLPYSSKGNSNISEYEPIDGLQRGHQSETNMF